MESKEGSEEGTRVTTLTCMVDMLPWPSWWVCHSFKEDGRSIASLHLSFGGRDQIGAEVPRERSESALILPTDSLAGFEIYFFTSIFV